MKKKKVGLYGFLSSSLQNWRNRNHIFSKSATIAMKLTFLLMFIFSTSSFGSTYGQKISMTVKNEAFVNVLKEIQRQSGYNFLFNANLVKLSKPVSLKVDNEDLVSVLPKIFKDQPFDYHLTDHIITVKPKEEKQEIKRSSTVSMEPINMDQQSIQGRVTDSDGKPLSGVTVTEVGASNVTSTDQNGRYTLYVNNSNVSLRFVLLGYTTITRKVTGNQLNITLVTEDLEVGQVVVTGFQKIDKNKFTGSVSNIDKKNIDRSGAIDVSRMLQGAAAGVSVQNTSGTFGSTPKIRIRGNSSISANQEPLYVINGVPIVSPANVAVNQLYSGDPATVLSSAIAGLNAQDIEDITILKDASASALYGTRAANGVILITTKRGTFNSRNVNVTSAFSVGIKPNVNQFNLMNSEQEMRLRKQLYDAGYYSRDNIPFSTGPFTDVYNQLALRNITLDQAYEELDRSTRANTDWFDVLFKNNVLQEHNVSFSGGGDKNTYYSSVSYVKDDGQSIGNNMSRFTSDLRATFNVTERFNLDLNLNWAFRNQMTTGALNAGTSNAEIARNFEINPFLYAMRTSRAMYPYQEDGSYKYYTHNYAPFNILDELGENFNEVKAREVRFTATPSLKITDGLNFRGIYAIRHTNNSLVHTITERSNMAAAHRADFTEALRDANSGNLYRDPSDPLAFYQSYLPQGGFIYNRSNWMTFWNIRNQLDFVKKIGNHAMDVSVGAEIEQTYVDRNYTKGIGYMYYGGRIISPTQLAMIRSVNLDDRLYIESFEKLNKVGFYGRAQYSLFEKYHVEGVLRSDGSNMFGRLQRSRFLPNYSVGLSWNVEREDFFQGGNIANYINALKLRASHGLRGMTFETSPVLDAELINIVRLDAENSAVGINIRNPELFNLAWEKDFITNIGLDITLLDRINFTAEYYQREQRDLVAPLKVALEEGTSTKSVNLGTMQNKGFDVNLGFNNVLNKSDRGVRWDVNLIYGYVENKLIDGEVMSSLLTEITRPQGFPVNGRPLEGLYTYNFVGLTNTGAPIFNGKDGNTTVIRNNSLDQSLISYQGSRQPLGTGSIANSFQYRGIELRIFLTYAYGHKVFMQPVAERAYNDRLSWSADLNYRWETIGDEDYVNIPGINSPIQQSHLSTAGNINHIAYNRSQSRIVDASHLRINEILLAFDLGKYLNRMTPAIKSSRLMLSANNIHYWASGRLRGVDPELYLVGGTSMPNPTSYTMRLTVGF